MNHRRSESLQPLQLRTICNATPISRAVGSYHRGEEACGCWWPFAVGQATGVRGPVWVPSEGPEKQLDFDREHYSGISGQLASMALRRLSLGVS